MNSGKVEYIYIHIPFCIKKCNYCSFFSVAYSNDLVLEYVSFLKKEIDLFLRKFPVNPKTIYFGGGTPSLLNSEQLNSIIEKFPLENIKEITLEANPQTLTEQKISSLKNTKINRISLGVQSFIDSELKLLGRIHDSQLVENVIKNLRKSGFNNISLDLIYGLPNQKIENIEYSLKKIIELNPEHISTYCLSLEKDVPLFNQRKDIPSDSKVEKIYYKIKELLEKNRYLQYEISNFSKEGKESQHNLSYWENKKYYGLGAGASGYLNNFRYKNPSNIKKYFELIRNSQICSTKEILTNNDFINEHIFLQMRKISGLDLKMFKKNFNIDLLEVKKNEIKNLLKYKKIIIENNHLKLSKTGLFISNHIFSELLI